MSGNGLRRREMLGAAGVAACGLAALTACGSGGAQAQPSLKGKVLAKTADVPVGGGKLIEDLKVVVTQPEPGVFKAFSSLCTHKGCQVGTPKDNVIRCACHGSEFTADTGKATKGPATGSLPSFPVKVEGDGIVIVG
ncbi:Rieske (2Fe-2S) protein [Nonomuraea sp. NPDC004580]|uniref:Rieske (2Fe-2S) protein n=1 Tax=Nonomuraea sp. NPDC004580 TaxID=3154552 RepID=UPI0033B63A0E